MICCDYERGLCGSADVDVWQLSDFLDPIKPKVVRVISSQQLACLLLPLPALLLAMSLINNRTFKRSMGHQISCEDARFHLHTSDRQHYPSNQQVRSCTDLGFDKSDSCPYSGWTLQ